MSTHKLSTNKQGSLFASLGIILASLGLAYAPLPGISQTIVIVSGSELEEPLKVLEQRFEQANPNIKVELKIQGSQDLVNNYLDEKNKFDPTILIPANGELLQELSDRWQTQNQGEPFYEPPRPLAKTMLVGIAWPDRGKALFPDGRFSWQRLEQAMGKANWKDIGGSKEWGSFDFVTTNPARSNSGQLTLSLWAQSKLGGSPVNSNSLSDPQVQPLFGLAKRSVYQPPRSTDILLQEFITRGPNDADVATVYESIALHRWQQAGANQGKPYQIYYLDPTIETVSTAAIVRRNIKPGTAKAAKKFLDFLNQPNQQTVFVQHGFRPVEKSVDLKSVPNSPWNQNIPGVETNPGVKIAPTPDRQTLNEIIRQWERAN